MATQTTELETTRKNPLKSKRFWGFFFVAMDVLEILTGDPLSLNGAVKWILFCSGSGLWLWGELVATCGIGFGVWQWEAE